MRLALLYMVILAAIGLSGCSRPSIEGEWTGTKAIGPIAASVRYTFDSAKHYKYENNVSSRYGSLRTVESGAYEIKDDRITFRQKTATVNGGVIQRAEALTETRRFRVKGDTLILNTDQPDKIVLARVKK